ncbi:MAG: hypothetical protein FWG69_01930 [Oscillospiraceae bacterium]|nr:hypothetical protein [Oscillospiraceae bacterium]
MRDISDSFSLTEQDFSPCLSGRDGAGCPDSESPEIVSSFLSPLPASVIDSDSESCLGFSVSDLFVSGSLSLLCSSHKSVSAGIFLSPFNFSFIIIPSLTLRAVSLAGGL